MKLLTTFTAGTLGIAALTGFSQTIDAGLIPLKSDTTILGGAANILIVYFLLALVIERGCEVGLSVLSALGAVPESDEGPDVKSIRSIVSVLLCMTFAAAISGSGLRLSEMILQLAAPEGDFAKPAFRVADTGLTVLVLAGGADGIHKMIKRILKDDPIPSGL